MWHHKNNNTINIEKAHSLLYCSPFLLTPISSISESTKYTHTHIWQITITPNMNRAQKYLHIRMCVCVCVRACLMCVVCMIVLYELAPWFHVIFYLEQDGGTRKKRFETVKSSRVFLFLSRFNFSFNHRHSRKYTFALILFSYVCMLCCQHKQIRHTHFVSFFFFF